MSWANFDSGKVRTVRGAKMMSVRVLFMIVVLPSQLVMPGYQQIRSQTAEVNFNGKRKKRYAWTSSLDQHVNIHFLGGKNGTAIFFHHIAYRNPKPCHNSKRKLRCRSCHLTLVQNCTLLRIRPGFVVIVSHRKPSCTPDVTIKG